MILTCDRIEEGVAVLIADDESEYRIPCAGLPFEVGEGDVFDAEVNDGVPTLIAKNEDERRLRVEKINALFDKLLKK